MKRLVLVLLLSCSVSVAQVQRSAAAVRAFRAVNPCPSTGLVRGACPGWNVDHRISLCAGGLDTPENLQWLSVEDHRWKTFVDARECRKLRKLAETPAR